MRRSLASVIIGVVVSVTPVLGQQAEPKIAGVWIGGLESAGDFTFYSATIAADVKTGTGNIPLRDLSGPLRIGAEGSRVRIEGPASVVLSGEIEADRIAGDFEAQGGRTNGVFRLTRIASMEPATVARYQGAYRFDDGRMLLVERALWAPSALLVTDATSGIARVAFAISSAQFVAGRSVLVPYPTEYTLSFEISGDGVTAVTKTAPSARPDRALRVQTIEEEVSFRNGDVTLRGTLLRPRVAGQRYPAIVFTHGAGPAVREWFWGFGYLMAARGFAVLAFDKRGVGESSGNWRDASFEDLADDAVAAARLLQARPDIDRARIGFWGLSQGAWIAPLAAVRSKDAAFVMTLSGGGLTPAEGELLDSEWELQKAGFTDRDIRDALAFQRAKNDFMRSGSGWEDYAARRSRALQPRAPWYALPGTDLNGPATEEHGDWSHLKRFYFYDPALTLRALRAPLLAIFGELDTPKGVELSAKAMTTALSTGGNRDFTVRIFPNGRHNLMDMAGAAPNEFARLQRFVPGLFETMGAWLERVARR
jgi:pimeloyl-ACP methyl ester carboxylesterase